MAVAKWAGRRKVLTRAAPATVPAIAAMPPPLATSIPHPAMSAARSIPLLIATVPLRIRCVQDVKGGCQEHKIGSRKRRFIREGITLVVLRGVPPCLINHINTCKH